jgi:hypothetical protein
MVVRPRESEEQKKMIVAAKEQGARYLPQKK